MSQNHYGIIHNENGSPNDGKLYMLFTSTNPLKLYLDVMQRLTEKPVKNATNEQIEKTLNNHHLKIVQIPEYITELIKSPLSDDVFYDGSLIGVKPLQTTTNDSCKSPKL